MKRVVYSEHVPGRSIPFSRAVAAGPLVFLSGQAAHDYAGGLSPTARPHPDHPYHHYTIKEQTEDVLRRCGVILEAAGCSYRDVVKMQTFHTNLDDVPGHFPARAKRFPQDPPPSTAVEVGLSVPGCEIEIDLIAVKPGSEWGPIKKLHHPDVPAPLAPYSQGMKAGPFLFLAGQLASDFRNGVPEDVQVHPEMPYFGSAIKNQTRYILNNIERVLEIGNASLKDVVKAQVFLTDMTDFYAFAEVWNEYFADSPPSTTVVQAGIMHPGCRIEIDVIALNPSGPYTKEIVWAEEVPRPPFAMAHAVKAGPYVFFGGLLPTDYKSGLAPAARRHPSFPRYATDIGRQGTYLWEQADRILKASGSSLDRIVKLWCFHTDVASNLAAEWDLREAYLGEEWPAITAVEVEALPLPAAVLALDGIAVEAS